MARAKKIDKFNEIKFQPNEIVYVIEGYYLEDFAIFKTRVTDIDNDNENGVVWYKLANGDTRRNIDCIFGTLKEAYDFICERINAVSYQVYKNFKQIKEGEEE